MTTAKKAAAPETPPASIIPDEDWTVAQVAAHMELSYQTARNQMLQGIFGQSKYDAAKRRLTVSANQVKRVKTMRGKPKRKRTTATKSKPSAVPRKRPHKSR